jgi:chondroitin AC lyase
MSLVAHKKWISILMVAALFLSLFNVMPKTATAAVNEDIELIKTRLQEYYLAQGDDILIANGIYVGRMSEAQKYIDELRADGSWADIDYTNKTSSANGRLWDPYIALYRMLAMAQAYGNAEHPLYGSQTLINALNKALIYWDLADPTCTNWWETEIGESIAMGRITVFVGGQLSPEALESAYKHNTGKLEAIGANGAWRTQNYLYEVLSKRDHDGIRAGMTTMANSLSVDEVGSSEESVQVDSSFWCHGSLLYSEGYGMSLFNSVAIWADAARGTEFALNREQLDMIAFYILDGTRWMMRDEIGMMYLGYRPASTIKGVTSYSADFIEPLEMMVRTDAYNGVEYLKLLNNIKGATNSNGLEGNKYFWRSDYGSHMRDTYGIMNRQSSTRTITGEYRSTFRPSIGNEIYWNSAGATSIFVNGDEYNSIVPAFDWLHYPGVTAPYVKIGTAGMPRNKASFVGGVTDGMYGANVQTQDFGGSTAKKGYFYFDDEMVALGADIASALEVPVHTTINQAAARANASVNGNKLELDSGDVKMSNTTWAYNDEIGYVFPTPTDIVAANKKQSSYYIGEDPIVKDVFTLYVDHGTAPQQGNYEYIVVPAQSSDAVKRYAEQIPVTILHNDGKIQAVRHNGLKLTQAIFYEAGTLDLGNGQTLTVDQPALVLLDQSGVSPKFTVSNPNKSGLIVKVEWTDENKGTTLVKDFKLGSGVYMGQSVSIALDEQSDGGAQITASSSLDDAPIDYISDGNRATAWRSDQSAVQWLTYDLGQNSLLKTIELDWGANYAKQYSVQISMDGLNWEIYKEAKDATGGMVEYDGAFTEARYIRLLLLEPIGDSGYEIVEFRVEHVINLAREKNITTSYGNAQLANDGNLATRWIADATDDAKKPQWLMVDLGAVQPIKTVRLFWEASYARKYTLQVSDDGEQWKQVYEQNNNNGGLNNIDLDVSGRYVRMNVLARSTTKYGVSMYEMEVFSDQDIKLSPAKGKENYALNKPVTVESAYNADLGGAKATDGDRNTRWASARKLDTDLWMYVDMKERIEINQVRMFWEAATPIDYKVQISDDAIDWVDVAHVIKLPNQLNDVVNFDPVTAQYVRAIGKANGKYGISAYEMEVYGGYDLDAGSKDLVLYQGQKTAIEASLLPYIADNEVSVKSYSPSVVIDTDVQYDTDGKATINLEGKVLGTGAIIISHANGDEHQVIYTKVIPNKTALQAKLDSIYVLDSIQYTLSSWNELKQFMDVAKAIMKDQNATDDDITGILSKLEIAFSDLKPAIAADTTELSSAISVAESVYGDAIAGTEPGQYPALSKTNLLHAIHQAKIVLGCTGLEQDDIRFAVKVLNAAVENFKKEMIREEAIEVKLNGSNVVDKGEKFELTYELVGNKETLYAQDLTISYDSDKLELVSVTSAVYGVMVLDQKELGEGKLRLLTVNVSDNPELTSGQKLKLTWMAKEATTDPTQITFMDIVVSNELGAETKVDTVHHELRIIDDNSMLDTLKALILKAQDKHDQAVEGYLKGQYPWGSKAALQSAIRDARLVVDNVNATAAEIMDAIAKLNEAIRVFDASQYQNNPADLTGDSYYTVGDLAMVAVAYGKTSADIDWDKYKAADVHKDNKIDIQDLTAVAKLVLR